MLSPSSSPAEQEEQPSPSPAEEEEQPAGSEIYGVSPQIEAAEKAQHLVISPRCPDISPGAPGHPLRGVSVMHLTDSFLRRVRDAGFDLNAKIFEIEPQVIRSAGEEMRCPRDSRKGAAYVDTLAAPDDAGAATHMLSYTWGYAVGDLVQALAQVYQSLWGLPKLPR